MPRPRDINLAFPLQLGHRLPSGRFAMRFAHESLVFSAEQLARSAVWEQMARPLRSALRQRLHGKLRTWWSQGRLYEWPIEMAADAAALQSIENEAPLEWRLLQTAAEVQRPADLVAWNTGRLLVALHYNFGSFMRVLHALEAHGVHVPSVQVPKSVDEAAASPTAPAEPMGLVHSGDLDQALSIAGAARSDDLRVGNLLRLVAPSAQTVADALRPLVGQVPATAPIAVAHLVGEILRIGRLNLRDDLRDVAERLACPHAGPGHTRDVALFMQRYGGGPGERDGSTLQALARVHGLTREGVRQRGIKMLSRLAGRSVFSPAFARVVEALPTVLPRPEAEAADALRSLLGPDMQIRTAMRYGADVLGVKLPIQLLRFQHLPVSGRMVWKKHATEWLGSAHSHASAMIRGCGLAYLPRIASLLVLPDGEHIDARTVGRALASIDGFEWLDENQEWFWFGEESRNNRLINGVRKLMSVARRPVDIEEIYGGISRMRGDRVRSAALYPPPPWAVQALCERLSFLRCKQFNDFYLGVKLSCEYELSPCELLIYQHMGARSGIGLRRDMHRSLSAGRHSSPMTLASALATSPMLKQVDQAVFALRGWRLDPAELTRVQAAAAGDEPSLAAATDVALPGSDEGHLEWVVTLTAAALNNARTSIPSRLVPSIPPGEYRLAQPSGCVRVSRNSPGVMTGVSRVARARGWRPGARIRVRLNPRTADADLALCAD